MTVSTIHLPGPEVQSERTEFQVVNSIGKTVRIFDSPDSAKAWAKSRAGTEPGKLGALSVEEVTTTVTETRKRIYRPRVGQAERRAA